ncbi:hypothetical protein DMUE_0629 [Dictyocoela muelleri]|nr:hypothetical protein DMUE_0629 [Dictyocoela muelleri]
MLPAIIIIISMTIILHTLIRPKKTKELPSLSDLDEYYLLLENKKSVHLIQKKLLDCAIKITRKINDLTIERNQLYSLYNEKIISDNIWNEINKSLDDYEYLKMIVQVEANKLKEGNRIFQDADFLVRKETILKDKLRKDKKKKEDTFFQKKREVLERMVKEKLKKVCEEIKCSDSKILVNGSKD